MVRTLRLHKKHLLCQHSVDQYVLSTGVNLIKLLEVLFTSVAIVLESENNSYTCKSFTKLTPGKSLLSHFVVSIEPKQKIWLFARTDCCFSSSSKRNGFSFCCDVNSRYSLPRISSPNLCRNRMWVLFIVGSRFRRFKA